MIIEQNSQYYKDAKDLRSAQDLIKYVSIETYNRIGFVKEYSDENSFMKIYEVTLTQNMVYEIIKFSKENKLNLVSLYESIDEKTNGSDILICIEFNSGYLKFPFQAKILSSYAKRMDGSYKSFWHENDNGLQIDLLKEYAISLGSYLGFYLPYNFTKGNINLTEKESYYGCSYISTDAVEKKYEYNDNVTFNGLNSTGYLKPLYRFFENKDGSGGGPNFSGTGGGGGNDEVEKFFVSCGKTLTDTELSNLHFHTQDEIFSDDSNWRNLLEDQGTPSKIIEQSSNEKVFNPRYKLVLMSKPISRTEDDANEIPVESEADLFKKNKEEPVYT